MFRKKAEQKNDNQDPTTSNEPDQSVLDKRAADDKAKADAVQNQPDAVKDPKTGDLQTPESNSTPKKKDSSKTSKRIKDATCNGTGLDPNNFEKHCPNCNGSGKVTIQVKKKGSEDGANGSK